MQRNFLSFSYLGYLQGTHHLVIIPDVWGIDFSATFGMLHVNSCTILLMLFSSKFTSIFSVYFINKDQLNNSNLYLGVVVWSEWDCKLVEEKWGNNHCYIGYGVFTRIIENLN